MIFDIQRYSLHDGDGIRTNVFFKGCSLHCSWCSNPESQSKKVSLLYNKRLCKGFGECTKTFPDAIKVVDGKANINRHLIKKNESLRDVCPSRALTISGELKSVDQLLVEIEKDKPFYAPEGGITLTGGEPFMQSSFLSELLPQLKQSGLNITIETCLHIPWNLIKPHLKYIDLFLADFKHTDEKKFHDFTGGDIKTVIDNFKYLEIEKAKVIARIPVIPKFNNTQPELFKIIDFVSGFKNIKEIHFIPFHNFGQEKYSMLDQDYVYKDVHGLAASELNHIENYAQLKGLRTKTGG